MIFDVITTTGRSEQGAHPPLRLASPSRSARNGVLFFQGQDEVHISQAAREFDASSSDKPIRENLVRRVKSQIAAGEYLTPERIDRAVDRLYAELVGR